MMTTIQEDKDYLMCSPSGNFGGVQKFPACIASKRNSSEGDFDDQVLDDVAEEHEHENDGGDGVKIHDAYSAGVESYYVQVDPNHRLAVCVPYKVNWKHTFTFN